MIRESAPERISGAEGLSCARTQRLPLLTRTATAIRTATRMEIVRTTTAMTKRTGTILATALVAEHRGAIFCGR